MVSGFEKRPVDSYRPKYPNESGESRSSRPDWRQRTQSSYAATRANNDDTRESRAASSPVSSKLRAKPKLHSSPPFTFSADSLKGHRRHDSAFELSREQTPARRSPPKAPVLHPVNVEDVTPGIILQLPRSLRTGEQSPSALLREQLWVNSNAANHPVLVWDVTTDKETGEKIARCLQMTSFHGQSVEEKYVYRRGRNSWRMHVQYVVIQQGRVPTPSMTDMPSVALEDNRSMEKRTYIHLDHYFDIETKFLKTGSSQPPIRLTHDSLCVVTFKFVQFVRGDIWRRKPNGQPNEVVSPLDRPGVSKLEIGDAASDRATAGYGIEDERCTREDLKPWSGKELLGPDAFYPSNAPERSQWNWALKRGTTINSQQTNNDITH